MQWEEQHQPPFSEDEPSVRILANQVLEGLGYTVLAATDGQEGLRVAREHQGARAFHVQVAAFQKPGNADQLIVDLRRRRVGAQRVHKPERNLYVVMAGPAQTYASA